ncbi:dinucleotide-utilizing enzyme [Microbacterium sp. zg-Y818]|uniref:dinucleotide-utilizing enzyme n=1 Tax=unclassified Microbacterium TaxID=2609290 RepID=UPI00214BB850|nr:MULTISPECIES: dinucleotide-utilizing enzyme [unclassified Microbacterium]MCR2800706.1 dinucleotide-utilizing enzyme [Microbacterium sp. zg.Y818]WIM23430.1 dinucleotide-utilizing enzyme [Microbacterium sp. zg-Y818]
MTSRPRLVRSIPFWILVIGSLATAVAGAVLLFDRLTVMATALTAGTATGVEVYVGQVEAVVGGILVATGLLGLALALTVASMRAIVPASDAASVAASISEPGDADDESATRGAFTPVQTTSRLPETTRTTAGTADEAPAITKPQAAGSADIAGPRP